MRRKLIGVLSDYKRHSLTDLMGETMEMIDDEEYKDRARKNDRCFTRNRTMPFRLLILHMLAAHKTNIQNSLEKFFEKLGDVLFMSKQSFSEARHKLNVCAFIELFHLSVRSSYKGYFDTWHGYRVMAIDGTDMALPMEPKLVSHYGTTGRGSTSPTARGSVLYDVLNKVVVDAQIAPMSCDERALAQKHLEALSTVGQQKKELVLFDRGYPSVELIKKCKQQGVKFVMRVRRKFNNRIDAQTTADGYVWLQDEDGSLIKVRVIKFMLESGVQETLLTDIWDKRMGMKAFKELYFMRWGVELEYDEVKNKLELENFTGRSVQAIEQDFYASMYLTNAAAIACWEAQASADQQRAEKENKYVYQINVNHAIGVLKDRFIMALLETDPQKSAKKIERILFLLAKSVSEVRPNRVVPRKKSRNAKFHHNKKSLA